MSDNPHIDDQAVDSRQETVSTQQPGYVATQQVTRDVAAEQRLQSFKVNRILYTLLGILEILLGLRFVLKLLAANPNTGFSTFIYGVTEIFIAPFKALLGTPTSGNTTFEVNTLIAMAVYALLVWIIARLIAIVMDRSTARTVTTSTQKNTTPPGPRL
jgi:YggT family protein